MIYTEYDPLEEVVVADVYPASDISHFFPDQDISGLHKILEETKEDCDNLAAALTSHGIRVYRPLAHHHAQPVPAVGFDMGLPAPPMTPRDHFKVIGNTVVQTYGSTPDKYFDGLSYYPIFQELFDQGYNWISQPAPNLVAMSGHDMWYVDQGRNYRARLSDRLLWHTATMFVLGDAVITNNRGPGTQRGLDWVERNLPDFRIIPNQHTRYNGFGHIDHGFFMVDDDMVFHDDIQKVPAALRHKQLIDISAFVPSIDLTELLKDYCAAMRLGGMHWIHQYLRRRNHYNHSICFDLNVLIIDRNNIIFPRLLPALFKFLAQYQINCHVCSMRHMLYWDSGIHCATLDLKRRGFKRSIV